jgi:hypothetical protein
VEVLADPVPAVRLVHLRATPAQRHHCRRATRARRWPGSRTS